MNTCTDHANLGIPVPLFPSWTPTWAEQNGGAILGSATLVGAFFGAIYAVIHSWEVKDQTQLCGVGPVGDATQVWLKATVKRCDRSCSP